MEVVTLEAHIKDMLQFLLDRMYWRFDNVDENLAQDRMNAETLRVSDHIETVDYLTQIVNNQTVIMQSLDLLLRDNHWSDKPEVVHKLRDCITKSKSITQSKGEA